MSAQGKTDHRTAVGLVAVVFVALIGVAAIAVGSASANRSEAQELTASQASDSAAPEVSVPDLVPVADSSGEIVGTVTKEEFLDPGRSEPNRSLRDRSLQVRSEDGQVTGYAVPSYGFVPIDEAEQFFIDVTEGKRPPVVTKVDPSAVAPPG